MDLITLEMKFISCKKAKEALGTLQSMQRDSFGPKTKETIESAQGLEVDIKHLTVLQLKRILILLLKDNQLLATDYVDMNNVTVPLFLEAFPKILDSIGMKSAKAQKLYVVGGVTGYIASRFLKDTRGLIQIQNDTQFDFDLDRLDENSLVILDSDVTEALYPTSGQKGQGPQDSVPIATGDKRTALNDTLFTNEEPVGTKPKMDGMVDKEEAVKIFQDWDELKEDPIKEDMVGRLHEFYNQQIQNVSEKFSQQIAMMESALKKKSEEAKRIRDVAEEEEMVTKTRLEEARKALQEAQLHRNDDARIILQLKQSLREKSENQKEIQTQLPPPQIEPKSHSEIAVKASASAFMDVEEASSETIDSEKGDRYQGQTQITRPMISTIKPATIGKFGIKVWTEENSLLDHMAQVAIGLEVAAESGHTTLSVQTSLIYQSLPARCQWTRSYIKEEKTLQGIIRKIVTLLEGGKELQLHAFMKIQRRRNEPLLEFFTKIRRIYGFSVGKEEKDLAKDNAAVSFMVQKMMEAMDESTSHEFTKRIEGDLEDGTLTFNKIADAIIRITRLSMKDNLSTGIMAQVKAKQVEKCAKCNRKGHSTVNCWKDIVCPKCHIQGHPGERCRQFPTEGQQREVATEGRRCFECKQRGHLKANCPNRPDQEIKDHSKWQNK